MARTGAELVLAAELMLADAAAVKHRRRTFRMVVVAAVMLVVSAFAVLSDRSGVFFIVFETFLPTQVTTVLEHVARVRVQCPKRALARFVRRAGHFNETVVERQRVPDGILPPLLVLSVEREQVHDELIDFREREHFHRRVLYGHCYERYVRIRRFRVRVIPAVRFVGAYPL